MADGAPLTFPELELIDKLISGLEALIHESDETPFTIDATQRPRRAVYRILFGTAQNERKMRAGEVAFMDGSLLILRCAVTEVVRLTPVEVMVQAEKSGRGETMAIIRGKARDIKRVRGGYEIGIDVEETRKTRLTPGRKLSECLRKNDPAAWNRWCQDIYDSIELMGMNLRNADLSGYDLCCADLSGADLSGANLGGAILAGANLSACMLEQASVLGADLFRAKMNRSQAALLRQSGMPEVESVIFDK
ncbi:MAG: pentapeptide repeat-containing protein [Planctomycetota bacterium]|jgi:hypothetical protein|nr:pentapeptide repeat-containing protein [Planctomycetota bacterium]